MKKLFLTCLVLILGACSNKPPSCADSDATDIIDGMIAERVNDAKDRFERNKKKYQEGLLNPEHEFSAEIKLKEIRMISQDNDTGSYRCVAKMMGNSTSIKTTNHPSLAVGYKFYQNEFIFEISYTTEILEDTGEVYVTVYGLPYSLL